MHAVVVVVGRVLLVLVYILMLRFPVVTSFRSSTFAGLVRPTWLSRNAVRRLLGGGCVTIDSVSYGAVTKSGVAVVRVSGSKAKACVEGVVRGDCPQPRFAALKKLYCPKSGEQIDKALVLWFPGPRYILNRE
jgi:hypothetical protein